jgi:nicotinate-nucleotide adenylyltransferase
MPVWYLVPDGVVQYIAKRNLYRSDDSARADGTAVATAPVPMPPDAYTTISKENA